MISTHEIAAAAPARMLARMLPNRTASPAVHDASRPSVNTRTPPVARAATIVRAAAFGLGLAALLSPPAVRAAEAPAAGAAALRFHTVTSADGVVLNVVEAGPAEGPPVLFLHGIGQSWLSWRRQLEGPLASRLRLVALDLRGHGDSGKPGDAAAYREACRWANDVLAVQKALGLEKPVLVAWSFGGLVAMHYLRCVDDAKPAGLVLVATAAGRLVSPTAPSPAAPSPGAMQAAAAARDMTSPDLRRNLTGARSFAALMTANPPDAAWQDETLAALLRMPAYVRRAMGTEIVGPRGEAVTGNADLAARVAALPLKVVTGGRDALSDGTTLAAAYREAFPDAEVAVYPGSGHSPFAEDATRFDAELEAFVSATAARPRVAD